jgi:flagellin-like protein
MEIEEEKEENSPLKRFRNGRRGISPIVSSLLMLLTTVIAFGMVLGYANNFMSAQRANTLATIRERLVVEDIWFHLNNSITVYVTNVGKVPVEITEIFINNENVDFSPSPLKLSMFEVDEARFNFTWISGNEYSFTVITKGGYYLEVSSSPL